MKGILFKPDMHLAIREGRKTVTRRLHGLKEINQEPEKWFSLAVAQDCPPLKVGDFIFQHEDYHCVGVKSRYQVGEVVFVQEAWAVEKRLDHLTISELSHAAEMPLFFRLDNSKTLLEIGKWRSPLFMPAWAARDFIKITDVRTERLQEITPEDVIKEGIARYTFARGCASPNPPDPRWKFIELWDSTNPQYPWASNPWAWRYEFKKVAKPV